MMHGKTCKPYPPKMGCVYAFAMSDGTTKIGVSQDADRRKPEVQNARCLDVLQSHHTSYAPYSLMTKIELACHAAFADRRVRGEYFNITFEEAVSEFDKHSDEIAAALAEADQRYIDELDYYYNEFLPEYFDPTPTEVSEVVADDELRGRVEQLEETLAGIEFTFKEMLESTARQLAPAEKAAACVCVALTMPPSPERQRLLLAAANVLVGRNIL